MWFGILFIRFIWLGSEVWNLVFFLLTKTKQKQTNLSFSRCICIFICYLFLISFLYFFLKKKTNENDSPLYWIKATSSKQNLIKLDLVFSKQILVKLNIYGFPFWYYSSMIITLVILTVIPFFLFTMMHICPIPNSVKSIRYILCLLHQGATIIMQYYAFLEFKAYRDDTLFLSK